jgi:hypothetical protein
MAGTMQKELYDAAKALQARWPSVWPFIKKTLPGLLKMRQDDLLVETLREMEGLKDKSGRDIDQPWMYADRILDEKKKRRCALESEREGAQHKMNLMGVASVADIMGKAQAMADPTRALMERWDKGEITDEAYMSELKALKQVRA